MGKDYSKGGAEALTETGMAPDYINAWWAKGSFIQLLERAKAAGNETDTELLERIKTPVETYEAYFRKSDPERAEERISSSDPEKIQLVNAEVAAYNAEIEQGNINSATFNKHFNTIDWIVRGIKR